MRPTVVKAIMKAAATIVMSVVIWFVPTSRALRLLRSLIFQWGRTQMASRLQRVYALWCEKHSSRAMIYVVSALCSRHSLPGIHTPRSGYEVLWLASTRSDCPLVSRLQLPFTLRVFPSYIKVSSLIKANSTILITCSIPFVVTNVAPENKPLWIGFALMKSEKV